MWALLLASLIWAFSFGMIGTALSGLSPWEVGIGRLSCAFLVFLPFIKRVKLSDCFFLLSLGAVQFGVMYACYLKAFSLLPASLVALYTIFTPFYVVLMAFCMGERKTKKAFWLSLLAVLGGGLLYGLNLWEEVSWGKGFFYVQLSNLCFALGQVAFVRYEEKRGKKEYKSLFAYLYAGALGALLLGQGGGLISSWGGMSLSQQGVVLYLGVVASGLGFFLWNYGASQVKTSTLAIMNNLKIPLAMGVCVLFFGEKLALESWLMGSFFLFLAVGLSLLPSSEKK